MSVAEMKQELVRLTDAERIELLEAVWASLDNKDDLEPPAWHEAELRFREEEIVTGKAKSISWEEAKADILRRTS